MRAVIQRVTQASVSVAGEEVATIGPGLCVLLGVTQSDGPDQVAKIARKIAQLRILDGDDQRLGAVEAGAPVLLVSQFTLYADVKKGRNPSWTYAASAEQAEPLFNAVAQALRDHGLQVQTGVFGAEMQVALVNDGPFTIIAEA